MSFLKKSLEKRIKELHASIEAQTTELAAYQQVLALETGKPIHALAAAPPALAALVSHHTKSIPKHAKKKQHKLSTKSVSVSSSVSAPLITAEFNGSRSDFVGSVLKERGAAGVTPQEVSAVFASRKIAVSKNLVYNVLSLMFKQKKVRKDAGRYYLVSKKSASPVPTAPKSSAVAAKAKRR